MGMSSSFPLRAKGLIQKRRWEDCKSQRDGQLQGRVSDNRTDTHMNSETIAVHTGPTHIQGRWDPSAEGE